MTDNHTELCKKLREEIALFKAARIDPGRIVPALAMIESQAARIQQQAERIAELEKERDVMCEERDVILSEVKSALVHERSLYLSKWKREAITACIDRVDALQAEKGRKS